MPLKRDLSCQIIPAPEFKADLRGEAGQEAADSQPAIQGTIKNEDN